MSYIPSPDRLQKYANILVNFALNSGKGINKGETVTLMVPESARPMLDPLIIAVLKAGGYPIVHYLPESFNRWETVNRAFYENATIEQLQFMPKNYLLGRIADSDHYLMIISHEDPKALEGVDSKKLMARQQAIKFYKDARDEKENAGKFTWTLALYGTQAMADEANMTLEEYWDEIAKACYLNEEDPIATWKQTYSEIGIIKKKLSDLKIQSVHVSGENIDLDVKIGSNRKWLAGSGRNVPTFEIYVSPDWRGTNGRIKFNQPLYMNGSLITDIELVFKDGLIIKSSASKNEQLLKDMIAVENANKIGEFSLTDSRHSKITKFMAETLFDENVGGRYGNTHLAIGNAYKDSFIGDITNTTPKQWKDMGFNESAVHTDIMSTEDRTVEATLKDGSKKIIYKDGKFTV